MITVFILFTLLISTRRLSHVYAKDPNNEFNGLNDQAVRLFKETHHVVTEDGYILTLHRMPGKPGSTPVFIQHGILESSGDFVITGTSSLPYLLLQRGYDIWLGNIRGNTFSKRHKTLSTSDPQFWNFSWSEIGYYDVPAMVTYISKFKNESLFYIGHSMGSSEFAVMSIERPEIAKNVRAFVGLAPAVYCYGNKSPFELFAPYWGTVQSIMTFFGKQTFFERSPALYFLANYICTVPILRNICADILFVTGGYTPDQLNYDLLPAIVNELPAGTSRKLLIHFLQQIHVNKFRKFDYGEQGNLVHYKKPEPPYYDLTKIDVPVALFYSKDDSVINKQNALDFYKPLRRKIGIYGVETLSHLDFLWGKDAPELVYSRILDIFSNFRNKRRD